MESYEQLLEKWLRSSTVMHIAHHVAASRYARIQRWLGAAVAIFGAIVASAIFGAAAKGLDQWLLLSTGAVSMATAMLSAFNTSLDAGGKAQRHYAAAAAFQGLRREIEEELVRCKTVKAKDSYEHLRKRWTAALEGSIPLPPKIHASVRKNPPKE